MDEETITSTSQDETQAHSGQPEQPDTQAVEDQKDSQPAEETQTEQPDTGSDEDVLEWAKKTKGLDIEELKKDPTKALKMVREAEKRMHEATTKKSDDLRQAVGDNTDGGETETLINRLRVADFYASTPEAREYDNKMAEIVIEKPYLAEDLDTVYKLARAEALEEVAVNARQAGKKEALAQAAKADIAAPPASSATTKAQPKQITDEDIAKMSSEEYEALKASGWSPWNP